MLPKDILSPREIIVVLISRSLLIMFIIVRKINCRNVVIKCNCMGGMMTSFSRGRGQRGMSMGRPCTSRLYYSLGHDMFQDLNASSACMNQG